MRRCSRPDCPCYEGAPVAADGCVGGRGSGVAAGGAGESARFRRSSAIESMLFKLFSSTGFVKTLQDGPY